MVSPSTPSQRQGDYNRRIDGVLPPRRVLPPPRPRSVRNVSFETSTYNRQHDIEMERQRQGRQGQGGRSRRKEKQRKRKTMRRKKK